MIANNSTKKNAPSSWNGNSHKRRKKYTIIILYFFNDLKKLKYNLKVEKIISTMDLVPGDVICIDPALECNTSIYCDVILLEGTCSMDESMLTGESHPIAKVLRFYYGIIFMI